MHLRIGVAFMARQCQICEKIGMMVWRRKKLRGKYNPTTKRKQKANLQWVQVPVDVKHKNFKKFAGKRVLACNKCRKTLLKKAK